MHFNEELRKETIDLLQSLVRIRSTNPPGNEDEIASFAQGYLHAHGISCRRVGLSDGRSSVIARVEGREPGSIVLCGHLDTVRIEEESWTVSPFDAQIADGKMWGRGTSDMKAGVAMIMKLGVWLAQWEEAPRKTVILALTADEENGFGGARSIAEAGLLDNAELLVVTEPTEGHPYVGEKGALWMEAAFQGRAAHGAVPHMGASAVLPACRYCGEISELVGSLEQVAGRGRTTINIGEIHGGWQINVVAPKTELKLDIRLVSQAHRDTILEESEKIGRRIAAESSTNFSQEILRYQHPIASDPEGEWVARFLESARKTTGAQIEPEIVPYATDGAVIVPMVDVPLIVCGPGSIAQAHQPDEFVELASVHDTAELLAEFLSSALR
jgi:succinyl-diaminopimelate desuccinylase